MASIKLLEPSVALGLCAVKGGAAVRSWRLLVRLAIKRKILARRSSPSLSVAAEQGCPGLSVEYGRNLHLKIEKPDREMPRATRITAELSWSPRSWDNNTTKP